MSPPLSGGRAGSRTSAGCRRRPPRRSPTGTRTRSPLRRRRRHAPESGIRTSARRGFPGSGRRQAHNQDSRRGRHMGCPEGSPSPVYGEDQHRHSFLRIPARGRTPCSAGWKSRDRDDGRLGGDRAHAHVARREPHGALAPRSARSDSAGEVGLEGCVGDRDSRQDAEPDRHALGAREAVEVQLLPRVLPV